VLTALIRTRRENTYEIDTASLMLASEHWIPMESSHELPLIHALVETGRRFVKPLRYDAKNAGGFANVFLLDVGPEPVPLHMVSPFMTSAARTAKEAAIAACGTHAWVWFTVRGTDFPNPDVARQIFDTYAEDRGQGRHLYRFPVVFPSDYWQTVMPHELAAWGASEKRYWSQYSPDGQIRHCMCHAPVPTDHTGRRTICLFGGRRTIQREDNGGICNPESCPEYQQRQCNLSGRFLFFIPGMVSRTSSWWGAALICSEKR
jgi:hypothetical protein